LFFIEPVFRFRFFCSAPEQKTEDYRGECLESRSRKLTMPSPFETAPNPCRLLVITPDEFAESLVPLLLHKNSTGMSAHLVKLSDIVGSNIDPSTHPLALKRLITQGHEKFGVWYVMLVGDASKVPVRHRFVRQQDGGAAEGMDGSYNPTDNYYANLYAPGGQAAGFSTWDANGDGKYNESAWALSPAINNPDNVDGWPHVAVGRVPAHTTQDVVNYVRKVIDYEDGLRSKCIEAFTFLSDSQLPGSSEACDNVIKLSKIEGIANAEVRRFYGNLPTNSAPPDKWNNFGLPATEVAAYTSKWLLHIGHGWSTGWDIALNGDKRIDDPHIRSWNSGCSYAYPIVLSAGCETGEFLNWAPHLRYRGLNPDKPYHFWFYKNERRIDETEGNQKFSWPLTVPAPHSYDFPTSSARTLAHAWLCGSATGGAIAYSGAMVVHQGSDYGADLFLRFVRKVGAMNVLGDLWAQAQRDYLADKLHMDDILGSPRIYLGIQTLFGDPSLRLNPVLSYGQSALLVKDRLTVFARTMHGTLTHKFYDPRLKKWTKWVHLGAGQISSGPAAVVAGDRLTVFARTAHGTLTHKFYDVQKDGWTGWIHLEGGEISSAPSAVMAADRLVVFARDIQGCLTHRYFDPQQQAWTDWARLGDEGISSSPSAVVAGGQLTVFARTLDGTLSHKFYDKALQAWTGWIPLGDGKISSAPSAAVAGDRLTVFARTMHGTLTHKFCDLRNNEWTDWIHLGDGQISSGSVAVMAGKRLTVFARTAHGTLTNKFYDQHRFEWTDWVHLGAGQIS
jgi:hypothetical protein